MEARRALQELTGEPPCLLHHLPLSISHLYITEKERAMTSSTVFTSNRSQAVRLPKAVAFPEDVQHVDSL